MVFSVFSAAMARFLGPGSLVSVTPLGPVEIYGWNHIGRVTCYLCLEQTPPYRIDYLHMNPDGTVPSSIQGPTVEVQGS